MLNNFYRSLGFKKINNNNYFIGCLSELFEPCLNKISFTHQDEEYERYLNDDLNIRNISVSLPSFNNEELFHDCSSSVYSGDYVLLETFWRGLAFSFILIQ